MFRHTLHAPRAGRGIALATTLLLVACLCSSFLRPASAALAQTPPHQRRLPTTLSNQQVHPGSALVAFRTPIQASGHHVVANGHTVASSSDLNNINAILDSLHAKEVRHLFTNIPAATLNAARAKAVAATGAYVTDFTQVYQVIFDQSINDGEAVNRLATSSLVSSAMPDWIFKAPAHESSVSAAPAASAAAAQVATAFGASHQQNLLNLPPNYGYIADGQSYHDAASNNVTGAWAMINDTFHKQPGQGEIITNVSLGTIDNTSTVLEGGQRYLEQRGFPKIPVWLSSCVDPGDGSCNVVLDPTATNTGDGQGDLIEVLLDFSVMAPPPRGDVRVPNPQAPNQTGELLGAAYGASYRLINPLVNTTPNFFAAFLGGAFLQNPPPTVMTASIGSGFGIGGFSDYFFEQDALIHDIVALVVNGGDIFVTISAGDGQTETSVAMNPNGITGPTDVTNDPAKITDISDPNLWANPNYSYGLTVEPEYVIDSGANDAGGNNLNDIFNNSPWNFGLDPKNRHDQHTTETRWTGQQNFHSGNGSRVNIAAPADNVLMLAQVEVGGIPVNPVDVFPRLIGGTSASSPEIAAAAAIVRQTSKLLGHPLTARQTRDLLVATGHDNRIPNFDLNNTNVGQVLDLTRAVTALFDLRGVHGQTSFVRMTVADRKGLSPGADFRSLFWSDTPQNPAAGTATIDLSQGLAANSSRTLQQIAATGDNLNAPISFAVDAAYLPLNAHFDWSLAFGFHQANVPNNWYDDSRPYLRLLPSEIFGLLGEPTTAQFDRTVNVTATSGHESITMRVTFKGQPKATYTHALPPSFLPVFRPNGNSDTMTIAYDLRGLRDGHGGTVDGGVLIVSDIDRAVPQAFPDNDLDAHGFKKTLHGLFGSITLSAAELPHGVGTYGLAVRGTEHGSEVAGSTSAWLPLRYAPRRQSIPLTPKVQAAASLLNGTAPLFYEAADIEPGGSSVFQVTYDVRNVPGAAKTMIEFSAPTLDFAEALFVSGNFGPNNSFVNNFTNPNGDRLDTGNNFGQAGGTVHVIVAGKNGIATLDGQTIGLSIPAANCDSTYQVRVFALDSHGQIVGVASNPSVFSYGDFSRAACFT